ncbi:MAG: DUF1553 domain-containing protein [Rhodothermaceae bacterium]|nr:DUF1553 domain-containing protein [Rhodothermaceae bacterium]
MFLIRRFAPTLFCLVLLYGCSKSSSDPAVLASLPETVDYNFHIKPILSDRCFTCHGPDPGTREADLRLDTPDGFFEKLGEEKNRQAVVRGKPHKSELIKRINHDDPDEVMPPQESNLTLTELEKALLEKWIDQGAEWKSHWAFSAPEKKTSRSRRSSDAPPNEIDGFILSALERNGLSPSPKADKETLLRRVTFDLTGLPPTLEEIDAFLNDTSDDAYQKVVDRLLASHAYGERMAAEWLDVARYADTGGYQSDRLRRMWPWRDWVIDAYNTNLPYDEFVTWQLAGDLLPDATKEQQLATAFNRNHRQTEEGGSIEEEFRTEYVADRAQTTATAFLGVTMECARCHDHKYDPISQKDYYAFSGFFNQIDESGQTSFFTDAVPVPTMLLTSEEEEAELGRIRTQITESTMRLDALNDSERPAFEQWLQGLSPSSIPSLPAKGLVAYLPLDQIRNEQTPNTINRALPGKTVFEPVVEAGKRDRAVLFDGENGIEVEGVGNFERSVPFSLSFWMKAGEWNEWNVLVHHTKAALDAGSRGYEFALQDNKVVFGLAHMWPQNAIRIVSRDTLTLDTWHHITATYDGSSKADGITLYIDGSPVAVDVVRDNLFKNITYERTEVNLTLGYRFRDTGFRNGLLDELRVYDRELVSLEAAQLAGSSLSTSFFSEPHSEDKEALYDYYLHHRSQEYLATLEQLETLRTEENDLISPIEEMMVMKDMAETRPTHLLVRGAYDNKGDRVDASTPERILSFPDSLPPNRLGLAQWVLAPDNPLTSRVVVNRYWQMLFGQGLVSTPDDFGNQGALPTHPDLLDWLAVTFMESGWDTKAIIKMIAMSATYQQSSTFTDEHMALDPDNMLLARGPSFRLTAEMARDQALAVSGALVEKIGGEPVKPYQPAGLWKEKSGTAYVRDTGEGLYRRSLYTFWKRTSPPPSMITFDASRRNYCVVRRQTTSTPLQALVLMNDPQFVEASRILAQRMIEEGGETLEDRLSFAFRLLTSRNPSEAEQAILEATYHEQLAEFKTSQASASELLTIGDAPNPESIDPNELAAYTLTASTIMNSDAAVIKR